MPLTDAQMAERRAVAHKRRGRRITYRKFVSKDRDFATGNVTPVYTNVYISHALVWKLTHETVVASNGRYRVGDRACSALSTEMPETPPNKQSRLLIDSVEYEMLDWSMSGDGGKYIMILRSP